MRTELETTFIALRPALLRHCYRMVGSFAEADELVQDTFERAWKSGPPTAPMERWLFTIATNACLNALTSRKTRRLPQLESAPARGEFTLQELEHSHWITPAPETANSQLESRESIALAFVALLQRLPAKQRAVLLMKDVLGWSAEEIAGSLELSVSSVNSALHRSRQIVERAPPQSTEPPPETLRAFIRAWETRDVAQLVTLLRKDVEMAMPPHAIWLRGVESVERFLHFPRFAGYWSGVAGLVPTRANGLPAFAFVRANDDGREALMVTRFVEGQVAEMTVFVGREYLRGFDIRQGTEQFRGAHLS